MSAAQEKMLTVLESPQDAQTLANFWQLVEGQPLQAAKILRSLEQSTDAVSKLAMVIPEAWQRIDDLALEADLKRTQFLDDLRAFRKDTVTELTSLAQAFTGLKSALEQIGEDSLLNKANRLIEVAEKLAKLKRDGTLELLKQLK